MLLSEAREQKIAVMQSFEDIYGTVQTWRYYPGEGWSTHHQPKEGPGYGVSTSTLVDWRTLKQDGWEPFPWENR